MQRNFFILLSSSIFIFHNSAIPQDGISLDKHIQVVSSIENSCWMKFKSGNNIDPQSIFKENKSFFGLGINDEMKITRIFTENSGDKHYTYQQYYKGIPVSGAEYIVHVKDNITISANGKLIKGLELEVNPLITTNEVITGAIGNIGAGKYMWEDTRTEQLLRRIKNDPEATFFPKPKLFIADPYFSIKVENYQLVYISEIYALEPLFRKKIFTDAKTGKILNVIDLIQTTEVEGIAITKYSGTQSIRTDSIAPDSFRLREYSRGNGIETYNMLKEKNYGNAIDFFDDDNYWNNENSDQDEAATDAHWATEMTYDYYLQKHGRNSYDNLGGKLASFVHYDVNYSNAFWNGSWMTYGDGNGTSNTALTSLDVAGHEITHGVTEFSANLEYQGESGALNESFSDIFACAIEYFVNPATADWNIGEDFDLTGSGFRSMSNPKSKNNPDTYLGQFWYTGALDNGGVHINSGVQNYWFYLLSDGGTGTNDNGNAYSVNGLGIDTAAAIAYRNLTVYLAGLSNYFDAHQGSIRAAEDLYGPCSKAVKETSNAWYAVGVGNPIADNDVWLIEIESPVTSCGLSNAEEVRIALRYNGCNTSLNPGDSIPIAFRVDNDTIFRDTIVLNDYLNGGDTLRFTFSTKADLSAIGSHTIDCWSEYGLDTENYNDSLLGYTLENKIYQNIDVGVIGIIAPNTDCNIGNSEDIEIELKFFGCDFLPANDSIGVAYRINNGNIIRDTVVLSSNLYADQSVRYTFKLNADLSAFGTYSIDAWTEYDKDTMTNNDGYFGQKVKNPFRLKNNAIVFENKTEVLDSFIIYTNDQSDAYVSSMSKNKGKYGFQMTGGDPLNYEGDIVIPDGTNNWLVNEIFSAKICFCVNADSWNTAYLQFALKQTYSSIYKQLLGFDVPYASSLRLLVNGNQIGGTYNPTTYKNDSFIIYSIDLNNFAGSNFELCFEARNGMTPQVDVFGDGDNAYLDNIYIGDFLGIDEEKVASLNKLFIYPNPSKGLLKLKYTAQSEEILEIRIMDIMGRILESKIYKVSTGNNEIDFDLSPCSPGLYIIKVNTPNGILTKRLIKK